MRFGRRLRRNRRRRPRDGKPLMRQGAVKLPLKPDGIGSRGGRGSGWFQAVGWLFGGCSAGSILRSQGDSLSDDFALRARGLCCSPPKSLSENGEGFCLGGKGSIGKARGGSRPAAVCDRQATPPAGPSLPNPPGGGSFRLGLRWFGRNRPQEVCPAAHRLAQPRIPQPQDPSPFSDRLYARSRSIPLCIGSLCSPLIPDF